MSLAALYSPIGLLVFFGALLLSALLYLKEIKTKFIPIANLCSLLIFVVSIICAVDLLSHGIDDPSNLVEMAALIILMNLYAALFNIAARVAARVLELMGNKRLKVKIHTEIVER
jgi:hypothetical protein